MKKIENVIFCFVIVSGEGGCREVTSTGESMCSVQARQEEARRKRRKKKRSGSSLVSSCFQGHCLFLIQFVILTCCITNCKTATNVMHF